MRDILETLRAEGLLDDFDLSEESDGRLTLVLWAKPGQSDLLRKRLMRQPKAEKRTMLVTINCSQRNPLKADQIRPS